MRKAGCCQNGNDYSVGAIKDVPLPPQALPVHLSPCEAAFRQKMSSVSIAENQATYVVNHPCILHFHLTHAFAQLLDLDLENSPLSVER